MSDPDHQIESTDHTQGEGEPNSAPPSDMEIPELIANASNEEFSQEVTEQLLLMQGESTWVGQLPRPDRLREYEQIYPGAAKIIIEHMTAPNKLMADSIAIDDRSSVEYWKWMNRQEDRKVDESRSDRLIRDRASTKSFVYLYAILAIIVVALLSPLEAPVRIAAISVLGSMAIGPSLISSIRGRNSDNEREAMKSLAGMARGTSSSNGTGLSSDVGMG